MSKTIDRKKGKPSLKRRSDSRGAPLTAALTKTISLSSAASKSIRGIARELMSMHSTEIAMRLREGMLSRNLRMALKYMQFVAAYNDGKPVETHRMVGLVDGPGGQYDITKLSVEERRQMLELLRKSKDRTIEESGIIAGSNDSGNSQSSILRVDDENGDSGAGFERRKTEISSTTQPRLIKGRKKAALVALLLALALGVGHAQTLGDCELQYQALKQRALEEYNVCIARSSNWISPGGYLACNAEYYAKLSAALSTYYACRQ